MVFSKNRTIHNYTLTEIENILRDEDKCTAIVSRMIGDASMLNNENISAIYIISRKDLKKNIAHYRVHVYNNEYALLFVDDGLYNGEKYYSFSSIFPGFTFV